MFGERKNLILLFTMLFLLLVMIIGTGRQNFFPRNAEAESRDTARSQIRQVEENSLLRKDLGQAMAILEACFNTPVSLDRVRSVPITMTAYTSTVEECDDTPYFTASSKPVRPGIVSVSDDLVKEMGLKFGQRVLIPGHGIFEVQDRMNPRMRRTVDIWMSDRKVALLFGRQKGTLFWIVPPEQPVTQAQSTTAS